VLTFWPYVWQLDPGHTYDEHLILALKTGRDTGHIRYPGWTCLDLWHPNEQILFGRYKERPTPPSLRWPLHWLEYTLNQHFLSSNPLSFKLHSNPSFLGEIWAILWVTLLIFKHSTSPMIFVCLLLLGTCPLDGLGVLRELPRLWWASESLYCLLLCGDLIVKNRTRSWWSFDEVWGRDRPDPLWTPQRRCRQPSWLAKLQE
jgi:hypothetical protein